MLIHPGEQLKLSDFDPDNTFDKSQEEINDELPKLRSIMAEMQYKLYIENEKALLIVLQGMDTSGKDGVIRHVVNAFNPVACIVQSFKVPTPEELSHDFLWRIHKVVPKNGFIGVFNRSHYEDVVAARVEQLIPESMCLKRFNHIKHFETMLTENKVRILKFFLHISKQEQKKRLAARLSDPEKRWKFNKDDIKKRKKWKEYMHAYSDAISICSMEKAPWYVIPANNKWFRNWTIANIITDTLTQMKIKYPKSDDEYKKIKI